MGGGKMEGKKIAPPKMPLKSNLSKSPVNNGPAKSPVKSFSTQKNTKPMTSFSKAAPQKASAVSTGERIQVKAAKPLNAKKLAMIAVIVLLTALIIASTTLIVIYPKPSRVSGDLRAESFLSGRSLRWRFPGLRRS